MYTQRPGEQSGSAHPFTAMQASVPGDMMAEVEVAETHASTSLHGYAPCTHTPGHAVVLFGTQVSRGSSTQYCENSESVGQSEDVLHETKLPAGRHGPP